MDLLDLDKQIGETIASAWSANTKSTRSSQWRIYIDFCHQNGLIPVPASVLTIARFLLYKSKTSKFRTVNNYFSAVIGLHRYHGVDDDYRSVYFMKLLMEGLRHKLGDSVQQLQSLSVSQLKEMAEFVDHSDWKQFVLWGSIVLSFEEV